MKIAVTGGTGLVGSRVIELLEDSFEFYSLSSKDIDITDRESVQNCLQSLDFDILLHSAAFTNVDQAEKASENVHAMNVMGTKNVYDAVLAKGKKFIYVSTDFVFDGTHPPYTEDSIEHPLGVYAKSKYEGEQIVKDEGMIVRISYPYRTVYEKKKDFVRLVKSRLEEGMEVSMISDSIITPTFTDDIAFALKHLFFHFSPEVYHLVGPTSASPFDAAHLVAKTFGLDKSLISKTTFDEFYNNPTYRPKLSEVRSVKNDFHRMHSLEEGLKIIKDTLRK